MKIARRDALLSIVPVPAIVLVWYALTRSGAIDPVFLPAPARAVEGFVDLLSRDFILGHLVPSLIRVGGGFILSVAIAFPLGVLSGQIPSIARLVHPLCGFTRYIPVAALVPLCILWFGIDDGQKIAVIALGVVFQLILLFAADTAAVPADLIEAGRTFGLGRFAILRRIVLPWSLPAIWDHLRIAAGWAWSYLVLSELVAGNRGIGYFIVQAQRYLQTDQVFAGILFVGLLGVLTDMAFRVVGARLFRWT